MTVAPGDTIEVAINVTAAIGPPSPSWQSTGWDVDGTDDCEDHADHAAPSTTTETFDITAPAAPGTYDLVIAAREQNDCTGATSGDVTLQDAIIVQAVPPDVSKNLIDGPNDADGADCTTLDFGACSAADDTLVVNTNDDGGIWVGLTESQHYVYEILIENDTGAALDAMVNDVVPADFDMDGDAEDANDDDCASGDGTCDGAESDNAACTFAINQPPSGYGIGGSKEPEFIDISVAGLADGTSCKITVYVMTVENPGIGNDLWEPTSCRVKEQTPNLDSLTSEDVIETFSLNEGVKVFDADDFSPTVGERLFGPVGSLQLTCNFVP